MEYRFRWLQTKYDLKLQVSQAEFEYRDGTPRWSDWEDIPVVIEEEE